jgi:hypothetical protein
MQPMFGGIYDMPSGPKDMYYNGPHYLQSISGKKSAIPAASAWSRHIRKSPGRNKWLPEKLYFLTLTEP